MGKSKSVEHRYGLNDIRSCCDAERSLIFYYVYRYH